MSKLLAFTVAKSQKLEVQTEGVYDSETQLWQAEGETMARFPPTQRWRCTLIPLALHCVNTFTNCQTYTFGFPGSAYQMCDRR